MVSKKVKINNATGFQLKPAGVFCEHAMKYKSRISFVFGNYEANCKSVLSVLGACIKMGDEIDIRCDGEDEEEALAALSDVVENQLTD